MTRDGFTPGRKARGRIPGHLRAATAPKRMRAVSGAIAAMWWFGWRRSGSSDDPVNLAREARIAAKRVPPGDDAPF